ncbi:CinA family protein, partial [Acinetobacter baumannii]
ALPPNIKLAYLPNYGMVRLRLSGFAAFDQKKLITQIDQQFASLKNYVSDVMVIDEDIPIQAVIGRLLKEKNETLATAESCTGGYIAHLITS